MCVMSAPGPEILYSKEIIKVDQPPGLYHSRSQNGTSEEEIVSL